MDLVSAKDLLVLAQTADEQKQWVLYLSKKIVRKEPKIKSASVRWGNGLGYEGLGIGYEGLGNRGVGEQGIRVRGCSRTWFAERSTGGGVKSNKGGRKRFMNRVLENRYL